MYQFSRTFELLPVFLFINSNVKSLLLIIVYALTIPLQYITRRKGLNQKVEALSSQLGITKLLTEVISQPFSQSTQFPHPHQQTTILD